MSNADLYDELCDLVAKQPVPTILVGREAQGLLGPADVLFLLPDTGHAAEKGGLRLKMAKKRGGVREVINREVQPPWPSK